MTKKTRLITHSGGFHADDIFGIATLCILFGKDNIEIIRTRDQDIISEGDYVLDVGFEYDPQRNRFDHHQEGGAGKRDNGVPYASFGLIWKKFGKDVCGSQEVANDLDTRLIQAIDSLDNGVGLSTPLLPGVETYTVSQAMFAFEPAWGENRSNEEAFKEALSWAQTLLTREIRYSQGRVEVFRLVRDIYEQAANKQIIVFDDNNYWDRRLIQEEFQRFPDVIYFVRPHPDPGKWQVICATDNIHIFKNRKDFPHEWAGKHDGDLARICGVPDAIFCHNKAWLCAADSKEGAIKLAEIALNS